MPSNTSFAQLYLYNNTTDKETLFSEFRERLAGTAETSNMQKIDKLLSQDNDRITNLENSPSILTARATTSDAGNNFIVTIDGFTEYKQDMIMAIYLSQNNVGLTTININNIGTKSLMKISEDGSIVNLEADDLKKNVGYLFQYDGTQFVLLQEVTVKDLYKTFLEFEETDEVVPPAPIDVDMLGGIPAANYLQKIYNAGSNNMLVNPRFKYNSRDQSSYTGTLWGLDGWYCANITQTGNILTSSDNSASIQQTIKNQSQVYGKTVTASIKQNGADVVYGTGQIPSSPSSTAEYINLSTGFGNLVVWYNSEEEKLKLSIFVLSGNSVTIDGVKLELGTVSTLQADLDNPPSEDIEKLKLDMYDLDPGRCAYLPWHNENLLDNWYFVGGGSQQGGGQFPINQRGETSYSGNGYGIDRWRSSNGGNVTINSDGISLPLSEIPIYFANTYDVNFANRLVGKTVTISALVNEDKLLSASGIVPPHNPNAEQFICSSTISGQTGIRLYFRQNDFIVQFRVDAGDTLDIQAVKLELGYLSTLARKDESGTWVLNDAPPNFQQELAKCQRYFLKLNGFSWVGSGQIDIGNLSGQFFIPTPVSMRVLPSSSGNLNIYNASNNMVVNVNGVSGFNENGINGHFTLSSFNDSHGGAISVWLNNNESFELSAEL